MASIASNRNAMTLKTQWTLWTLKTQMRLKVERIAARICRMPDPTPFYPRTSKLCKSMMWRYWGEYFVPSSYEVHHDIEYYAIRNSAALIDITPLYKYDVTGPD